MTKEAAHRSEQEELRTGGSLHCHRDFLSGWCRKLGSHLFGLHTSLGDLQKWNPVTVKAHIPS